MTRGNESPSETESWPYTEGSTYRRSPPDPIASIGMVTVSLGATDGRYGAPVQGCASPLPAEFLQAARRSCCHPQWEMSSPALGSQGSLQRLLLHKSPKPPPH